jgi:hypothetical protein
MAVEVWRVRMEERKRAKKMSKWIALVQRLMEEERTEVEARMEWDKV